MGSKKNIVIIGAGIGGLATAAMLAKAGHSVSVYEKNSGPGGRAGLLKKDGFSFDTGPSWYLMPSVFEHFFSLFDKKIDDEFNLVKLSPAYKVFFEKDPPITITGDASIDKQTFEEIEVGAGARLEDYISKGDEIYQLALRNFLYTNFSSVSSVLNTEVLRHAFKMATLAFRPIDPYVRRFVTDERLVKILEYPMVFLGSSPYSAPAIYSLMSALDFKEGVFYPQGGLYTITQRLMALCEEHGVEFYFDSGVEKISVSGGATTGIVLSGGQQVSADIVISNADLHFTETKLLEIKNQSYPESYWSKKEAGPSALLMYLGVKGTVPELEHHNLFFVDNWKENFKSIFSTKNVPEPASTYICKPSATDPSVAPKGHENIFVLIPLPSGVKISEHDKENITEKYLESIERYFGIAKFRERIVTRTFFWPNDFEDNYNAWQGTALGPSHILKQSAFFRTPVSSPKVKNLYYVGGFTRPGVGIPMCLISAELVYKKISANNSSSLIDEIIRHDRV